LLHYGGNPRLNNLPAPAAFLLNDVGNLILELRKQAHLFKSFDALTFAFGSLNPSEYLLSVVVATLHNVVLNLLRIEIQQVVRLHLSLLKHLILESKKVLGKDALLLSLV
jgi:hypothetical protein